MSTLSRRGKSPLPPNIETSLPLQAQQEKNILCKFCVENNTSTSKPTGVVIFYYNTTFLIYILQVSITTSLQVQLFLIILRSTKVKHNLYRSRALKVRTIQKQYYTNYLKHLDKKESQYKLGLLKAKLVPKVNTTIKYCNGQK